MEDLIVARAVAIKSLPKEPAEGALEKMFFCDGCGGYHHRYTGGVKLESEAGGADSVCSRWCPDCAKLALENVRQVHFAGIQTLQREGPDQTWIEVHKAGLALKSHRVPRSEFEKALLASWRVLS